MSEYLLMLPGPTNVDPRVSKAMLKPLINHRGPSFHRFYAEVEEKLRYVFETRNSVIPLTSSGTGGMDFAVSNVVSEGDKVLIPTFGFFCERVAKAVEAFGGQPVKVPTEWGCTVSAEQVVATLERERDVKAVVIVNNETSTGVKVRELREIGKFTKERGIFLIVDAISILGGDKLPVDEWGIDVCATASQKCLACPPGLALVSVSDRVVDLVKRKPARTSYFNLSDYLTYMERGETPYTPSLPLFYALNEALDMVMEEGLEKRFERHRRCAEAFYHAVERLGLQPFPRDKADRSNTVVAVHKPQTIDLVSLVKTMMERYNVVIASGVGVIREKVFRIGSMGVVSSREVTATVKALEGSLLKLGYSVDVGSALEEALKHL